MQPQGQVTRPAARRGLRGHPHRESSLGMALGAEVKPGGIVPSLLAENFTADGRHGNLLLSAAGQVQLPGLVIPAGRWNDHPGPFQFPAGEGEGAQEFLRRAVGALVLQKLHGVPGVGGTQS